jgi:purine nucleosidase
MRLVIDTDTGSDDAVALMLALGNPKVRVEAITTVAGNVPLSLSTRNAQSTVALMGSTVPVYSGLGKPLSRALHTAQDVHGEDGMGGAPIPLDLAPLAGTNAVQKIIELGKEFPGELTLVTLGPLTNIAAALIADPLTLSRYQNVYLMAGAPEGWGNVTASAEFNVWCDPESFKIVMHSGTPVILVGWNISRDYAVITDIEEAELKKIATARSAFVVDINKNLKNFCRDVTNLDGFDLPDPITVTIAIDPTMVKRSEKVHVDVYCSGGSRGTLILDRRHTAALANAEVIWEVDRQVFLTMLYDMCKDPSNPAGYLGGNS